MQRWGDGGGGVSRKKVRDSRKIRETEGEEKYDERGRGLSLDRVRIKISSVLFFSSPSSYFGVRGVFDWGGGTAPSTSRLLQHVNDGTHIDCVTADRDKPKRSF